MAVHRRSTEDEKVLAAAKNAALALEAIYVWLDRVDAAGGATSISGVAECHAFLQSLRKNRGRVQSMIMAPLLEVLNDVP